MADQWTLSKAEVTFNLYWIWNGARSDVCSQFSPCHSRSVLHRPTVALKTQYDQANLSLSHQTLDSTGIQTCSVFTHLPPCLVLSTLTIRNSKIFILERYTKGMSRKSGHLMLKNNWCPFFCRLRTCLLIFASLIQTEYLSDSSFGVMSWRNKQISLAEIVTLHSKTKWLILTRLYTTNRATYD